MKQLPDLEYKTNGIFTMFFANTDIGAAAYGAIAAANGGIGNIPTAHLDSTMRQLRAAGITIKKYRACKLEGDDLLADLGISV